MSTDSRTMLQAVSRSFALCIPFLEENKVREVENMYLLSRVVDTIEDSSHDVNTKKELMDQFFLTLDGNFIPEFTQRLGKGIIDEHDKIIFLTENYRQIIDTFNSFDKPVRDISLKFLLQMSSGMKVYLNRKIRSFDDLNDYCFFVAGTVGLYMNRMTELKDGIKLDERKAVALGRLLQKTNIIKNFRKDMQEGRTFWPLPDADGNMAALEKMVENACLEKAEAFDYIASVPLSLPGYRRFLLLSAFMATENLKLMKNNPEVFTNPEGVKIPRSRMPDIFEMMEKAASSNNEMWKFKKELEN